jgi:hydroxymethylglutaryl-CoA reductase (NADPH)
MMKTVQSFKGGSKDLRQRTKGRKPLASDALSLPVGLTNKVFIVLSFSASYYLVRSWRDKIRASVPLHMLNFGDVLALIAVLASFIYLIGFFGTDRVQNFIRKSGDGSWDSDDERENLRQNLPSAAGGCKDSAAVEGYDSG